MLTPSELSRVEALEAQMGLMSALRGDMIGSLGNWNSYFARFGGGGSMSLPANQTAPNSTCVAALTLQAQTTGMFLVWCAYQWSDDTNADLVTHRILVNDVTPGVLAGTNFQANGFHGANALGASSGVITADAAGGNGITVDGNPVSGFATSQIVSSAQGASLTGLLTAQGNGTFTYSFVGIVGKNNNGVKAPVTIGHKLFAGVSLIATHVITISSISMGAVELPVG